MRHATGWGLAVIGAFAVASGVAIDCHMYAAAIAAALSAIGIGHVGPRVWE